MLIDLLNSSNYIMVNMDAIRIFGLNTAIYCAELLNIYKKAVVKKKLIDEKYFKIDRDYITKRTSLTVEDQLKCDINLIKVNIIKRAEEDPDIILFDVEVFASLLSSEDIKLLDNVSKKVKINNPKGTKQTARERVVLNLKNSIICNTPKILYAMRDWIDTIMADPNKYLSVQQVTLFKDKLDDYCNGNLELALKIIESATIHQYIDCQWAINSYEKDKQVQSSIKANTVRKTEQKLTDLNSLQGGEVF